MIDDADGPDARVFGEDGGEPEERLGARIVREALEDLERSAAVIGPDLLQDVITRAVEAGGTAFERDAISRNLPAAVLAFTERKTFERVWNETERAQRRQEERERKEAAQAEASDEPDDRPHRILTSDEQAALRAELAPRVVPLLQDPHLTDRIVTFLADNLHIAGQRSELLGLYLAGTSRVLGKPVSIDLHGPPGSGKSRLMETVLRMFPEDAVYNATASSAKALIYVTEDFLQHRIVYIGEGTSFYAGTGVEETTAFQAKLFRELQSEGRFTYSVVVTSDEPGGLPETKHIVRRGPISLWLTSTQALHSEDASRMLQLRTEEDSEHTRAVLLRQAAAAEQPANESVAELALWIDVQRWLGAGSVGCIVPFAARLAALTAATNIQIRRDFNYVLSGIQAHALLHQLQRQRDQQGRTIAERADYEAIYATLGPAVDYSSGGVVEAEVRRLYQVVFDLALAADNKPGLTAKATPRPRDAGAGLPRSIITVTMRQLGQRLGYSAATAYRNLTRAYDAGLIENRETRSRQAAQLKIVSPIEAAVPPSAIPPPMLCSHRSGHAPRIPPGEGGTENSDTVRQSGAVSKCPVQHCKVWQSTISALRKHAGYSVKQSHRGDRLSPAGARVFHRSVKQPSFISCSAIQQTYVAYPDCLAVSLFLAPPPPPPTRVLADDAPEILNQPPAGARAQPNPLRPALVAYLAAGGQVRRAGEAVTLDPLPSSATDAARAAEAALRAGLEALASLCVPSVTPAEAAAVRAVLEAAAAHVHYVTTETDAAAAVADLRARYQADAREHGGSAIGIDFETEVLPELRQPVPVAFTKQGLPARRQPTDGIAGYALDPFNSRVRLVQLWVSGPVYVFDRHAVPWSALDPLFDDRSIVWAAFAATFEAKRLLHETGRMPAGRLHDTRTAVLLTHGVAPNLEDAADLVFGFAVPKVLGASDWSATRLSQEQLDYASLDAVLTAALWHQQRGAMAGAEAETAQRVADNAIASVARAELAGVGIDVAAHRALIERWQRELTDAIARRAAAVPGLLWNKRDALQAYLADALAADDDAALDAWPRTATGLLVTRRASLERARHIPGIGEHLDARRLGKLLDSFGTSLLDKINPRTERIHASLLICGARTGRFASKAPNLQQLPKRRSREFRSIIVPAPGHLLLAADYSQIELRAGAELICATVGYSRLRDGFAAGLDAHRTTALLLAGKNDPNSVTGAERDQAKPANFGLLYGMSRRGFFHYVRSEYQPNITEEEADALFEGTFEAYPELAEWHYQQERACRRAGYVDTPLGRRWHWRWRAKEPDELDPEELFFEDKLSGFQRNYSFNHPVQGGCAEVMLLAMARVDRALRGLPARIVLSVHDEILIELRDDLSVVSAVHACVVEQMTTAFLHVFPDAPTLHLIEPTIGPNWGEMRPVEEWLATNSASELPDRDGSFMEMPDATL